MSQEAAKKPEVAVSPKDFFLESLERAFQHLKIQASPLSKNYLVDLLQFYMFAKNLFGDDESGRARRETLAEMYMTAQSQPINRRIEILKKLGDTSLYISGFFGDSLNRKLVDIDYYAEMGGAAYGSLSSITSDENLSVVYSGFSNRFLQFVDALTYISQRSQIQTNEDLLRLYDRYVSTGSRLAEEQLRERGVLNAELARVRGNKQ